MMRNRNRNSEVMNDKQLVMSCLRGDEEEFHKIVDKYKGKAMGFLTINTSADYPGSVKRTQFQGKGCPFPLGSGGLYQP